jgi:hypothetical protein
MKQARSGGRVEARDGIEPPNKGFATFPYRLGFRATLEKQVRLAKKYICCSSAGYLQPGMKCHP